MYIKQVSMQGFKSYKNETFCEPFSPKHNVIVGRNGSGKSNFFFAIRFVLSDMYASLSNQERSKLLHGEGVGMSVMSAYVEIIFDNSDNRIPIEREEVALRRSIGLKKDEYFLDSKHISKTEVMNLLESSGFSRSNPYYIVQQGKIMELATMKDSQRLNLLKEVAGTGVYDARRSQSLQILEDTGTKKDRIEEVLNYIEDRLEELEDEKDELKEYQELDRSKRAIEWTIYDKELRATREALERLDEERREEVLRRNETYESLEDNEMVSKNLTDELNKLKSEIDRVNRERRNTEADKKELIKDHAKLELDVQELRAAVGNEKQTAGVIRSELAKIQNEIQNKKSEVEQLTPELEEVEQRQQDLEDESEKAKARQQEIFSKQTRTTQFKSEKERDKWIDEETQSLKTAKTKKEKVIKQTEAEIQRLDEEVMMTTEEISERVQSIEQRKHRIAQISTDFRKCKAAKDGLTNQRKELWAEDAELDGQMSDLKTELSKTERALYSTTSRAKAKGLEVVEHLKSDGMPGIYGKLVDLIDCDEQYRVAVEVTAMDSMFNVVVENDDVASKIIDHINRKKIEARVTCLPLNRLKHTPPKLQQGSQKDYIAIVRKIKCAEHIRPAVNHVFGKTIICRDLDVAAHYSNQQGIDAVTLDGDKVSKKGSMHGGYYDEKAGKMELAIKLRKLSEEYGAKEAKSKKIKAQVNDIGQEITQELATHHKLEAEKGRLHTNYENLQADEAQMRESLQKLKDQLASEHATLAQLKNEAAQIQDRVNSLKAEKGTSLDSSMDAASRRELEELTDSIAQLTPQITEVQAQRESLVEKKDRLERQLRLNLEKQEKKLLQRQEDFELTDRKHDLESKAAELEASRTAIDETTSKLSKLDVMVQQKNVEANEITASLDEAKAEERKRMVSDADADKRLEMILNKRAIHLEKVSDMERKIRELGALPKDYDQYANLGLKPLYKQLTAVNKKLKDPKYRQVNKKALDQYLNFSEQRDVLVRRKGDQDNADQSIKDLIQVLDGQKDEAIERTFKQVSMYFKEVFRELVPGGEGALVMQKRADATAEDIESLDSQNTTEKTGRIEQYIGVAVRVTFTGKNSETQLLQQLSGGQRTIVALALIFAIQRCDPAPFYLFDEIDAALDAAHRTAVADMIARLSQAAQFVVTTFRPEMLQKANKFYGVTFKNKVSRIDSIPLEKAMEFIEDDAGGK